MATPSSKSQLYGAMTFAAIMVLVAAGLIFVIYREQRIISSTVNTHASEDTRSADLLKIARMAEYNPAIVADISKAFQSATDTVSVIEEIEKLGAASQVAVSVDRADKSAMNDRPQLLMGITAKGSWANVYRFVAEIETFPYMHVTRMISFSKGQNIEGAGDEWSVTMEITVPLVQQ